MDDRLTNLAQAFENTSTNVAAAQMRNSLTNLAETVEDPQQKKVSYIPYRDCQALELGNRTAL